MKNIKSLNSSDLKETNRLYVLELIRRNVCSRAEISTALGLSRPSVSNIVDELIDEDLVIEVGRGQSTVTGGKKPILLDFNSHAFLNVAVYFNGYTYEIALTDLSANVVCHVEEKMNIYNDFRKTFDEIVNKIQEMIKEARAKGLRQPILACGVSLKGLVNTQQGIISYASRAPVWRDIPVASYLRSKLNMPVFIENDARANTIAELLLSEGINQNHFVCVTLDVGIGTGVVIQNEVFRGENDNAVNFAHTTVSDQGPLCKCGNRGCWESLASVTAFLQELERRDSSYNNISIHTAIKKFHEGDALIRDVLLNYTGYWLAVGLANVLKVFNPGHLVIKGEITKAGEELKTKILEVVNERSHPVSGNGNILFSTLTEQVSIKSAAVIVIKKLFMKEHHREIFKADSLRKLND